MSLPAAVRPSTPSPTRSLKCRLRSRISRRCPIRSAIPTRTELPILGDVLKLTSRLTVDRISTSPTVTGGIQTFNGYSSLQANHAGAVAAGSTQFFNDNAHLRASKMGAVTGGTQTFNGSSFLWAKSTDGTTTGAVTGGTQIFRDSSSLVAATANAVAGSAQPTFRDSSTLYANVTGAISGVTLSLYDAGTIILGNQNALSPTTKITFNATTVTNAPEGPPGGRSIDGGDPGDGILLLNGFNTTVGSISSVASEPASSKTARGRPRRSRSAAITLTRPSAA